MLADWLHPLAPPPPHAPLWRPPSSHISVLFLPRPLTPPPAAISSTVYTLHGAQPTATTKTTNCNNLTYEGLMVILQGGTLGAGPRRQQRVKRRVLGGSI